MSGYPLDQVHRFHREIDGLNWQFGGEKMRYNFLRRTEFLPHMLIYRQGEIAQLEQALRPEIAALTVESRLGKQTLDGYVQAAPVNGIIILQHQKIVYERYPRMQPFDKHLLMSVSKVFISTVIALLESRQLLDPSRPVDHYLPEIRNSGWESVPLQDVLDMASGIDAPEVLQGFTNPEHPYYRYEASLGWLPTPDGMELPSTYAYVAQLKRKDPPGTQYEYTSVNTFLLATIAERLTGLPLADTLTQEIWNRIGAEADGFLAVSTHGAPAAHGGLCCCLRDLARFGLLFTPAGGVLSPQWQLPKNLLHHIQEGGRPEIFLRGPNGPQIVRDLHGEIPRHNTWQWDYTLQDGDFFKGGYGGQGLYISPGRDTVIAYFGSPFDEKMETHELQWITRQIMASGILDD